MVDDRQTGMFRRVAEISQKVVQKPRETAMRAELTDYMSRCCAKWNGTRLTAVSQL
jgi:hypothetical protein